MKKRIKNKLIRLLKWLLIKLGYLPYGDRPIEIKKEVLPTINIIAETSVEEEFLMHTLNNDDTTHYIYERLKNELGKQVANYAHFSICENEYNHKITYRAEIRIPDQKSNFFELCCQNKKAEWWRNEEGGYFCSECGGFYDDYYVSTLPKKCISCGSKMVENNDMEIDRHYRLSRTLYFVDESEYPSWLIKMRGGNDG